ncbi:uncharacterized protein LAESUDRAFT_651784 [Laetiporus sulphureus 93-53]|uniref:MYND-type domain-containing protein n=1 Tax=Laetiporus sulphureus 93-53 TaxID=1314785 RepID=A0A165ELN1_9APHY|nr:uncharacterized protein LAESUDRAFT_651784 [Laetiporus sulphureus 93-53]KZT07315.1 hypothetical protein LAESUDRAFT_651784 [Laetiporus sulphureus 93-53]
MTSLAASKIAFCDNPACVTWKTAEIPLKMCSRLWNDGLSLMRKICHRSECQKLAWPAHVEQCKALQAARCKLRCAQHHNLWAYIHRWATRNRTPLYNALLAAVYLSESAEAHKQFLLVVKLHYSPSAKHLRQCLILKSASKLLWSEMKSFGSAWMREKLSIICAKREQPESIMNSPQGSLSLASAWSF